MTDWDKNYRSASMVGRNPEIVRDAANAEIERLRAALSLYAEEGYNGYNGGPHAARRALEGKND